MSHVKVVELNIEGKKSPNLAPIVHTIRQQSKKQLNELLQNLFNNTDDALFELADRSQSDQHQEMYFDSMRMIRLHRKTLASSFMRGFYDSFNTAFETGDTSDESAEEVDPSDYSLLDQDELEMSVAVSGIVSKVTSQYSLAVMQLTKRLDYLAKQQTITERTNPLGPHALSTTFADVLGSLEVDIKIRIILMKMFERFVMERLGPIYETANRALIDADVLPDLRNKPAKGKASTTDGRKEPKSAGPAEATSEGSGSANSAGGMGSGGNLGGAIGGAIGFNTVQSLLAGSRDGNGTGMAAASGISGSGSRGGELINLPILESTELVRALSRIQQSDPVEHIDLEHVPELGDVRTLVLAQSGEEQKSLGQADDDTVNFVGMLFDYILNDRNLAIPMKALISRLQIPIIKLAILDKGFFEKPSHPARALLNELSSAGIGWSGAAELKRDALYNKIESVVLRVLNEFSENPDIFMELLQELRTFVSKDSRRSVLVEQRVKESESGKAKTHDAKLKVQNLVNQKACGLRLPSEVGKFISEIWTRVLTLRIVKHGSASLEWTDGVATLDDLLWGLQPLSELDAIAQRDGMVPGLISNVREGMSEIGCPAEETDLFCDWAQAHLDSLSANDREYLEEDERPDLDVAQSTVEEIVLAAPSPVLDVAALSSESQAEMKLLTEGTWVEIAESEQRTVRCKLATVTQPGSNYIFVNRRGMKVLEHSAVQLGELIEEKKLKRIDESQVFDRALQSVIGNLRQMQRERTQ